MKVGLPFIEYHKGFYSGFGFSPEVLDHSVLVGSPLADRVCAVRVHVPVFARQTSNHRGWFLPKLADDQLDAQGHEPFVSTPKTNTKSINI